MARGPKTRSKAQPDRIQARHFHHTFAALYPGELTFAHVRDAAAEWAGDRGKLLEYNIGREQHETPADSERDEHFHVYVHYDVKIDVNNWRKTTIFDLEGKDQRVLHPEVQKVGGTPGDRHEACAPCSTHRTRPLTRRSKPSRVSQALSGRRLNLPQAATATQRAATARPSCLARSPARPCARSHCLARAHSLARSHSLPRSPFAPLGPPGHTGLVISAWGCAIDAKALARLAHRWFTH